VEEARRAAIGDGQPAGRLTIGSLETTAALRLAPALADYAATWPDVDLVLRTGTTAEMTRAVLQHEVEGAFVCGPVSQPELVATSVFREELMVATARRIETLDALFAAGAPKIVVLRAGCSYRQRLEAVLAARGVSGLRLLEFGTIDALTACVTAGVGITLLPRGILETANCASSIRAHRLPPLEAWVDTVFLRRHDAPVSSALEALLDGIKRNNEIAEAA
jgi:DNA-binding transcriptional LysR family regulator